MVSGTYKKGKQLIYSILFKGGVVTNNYYNKKYLSNALKAFKEGVITLLKQGTQSHFNGKISILQVLQF